MAHQTYDGRDQPPDPRIVAIAGPAGEIGRLKAAEAERGRYPVQAERHQDASIPARRRLVLHPQRVDRVCRPGHHHGPGSLDLTLDDLGEALTGDEPGIPPDRQAFALKQPDEGRDPRLVLTLVT
jgi:hypothetical protein